MDEGKRYTANLTVLASPEHGPQLCTSVALSLPPQCSGPDVVGWDWKAVKHEEQDGTRWGSYRVVGTWDGERLTLTEPPGEPPPPKKGGEIDFSSPCPEPAGGWQPVAPAKATQKALDLALERARKADGYAGSWVDQSYLDTIEGYDGSKPEWSEKYANDPKRLVLNIKFTGDPAAREALIREVWGGALCLSKGEHSQSKLLTVQDKIYKEIKGVHSSGPDTLDGRLHVGVWVATDALQRQVDEKYGAGVVVLEGTLEPV